MSLPRAPIIRHAACVRALTAPWLAVAVIGLSLTLQLSDGFYNERALTGLGLVLVAAVLGVAGVAWPLPVRTRWRGESGAADPARTETAMATTLLLGVLASAFMLVTAPLGRYMADPRPWSHPWLLAVVGAMAAAAILGSAGRTRRGRVAAALIVLAGGLWLGAWTVRQSPTPHIDVIPVHVDAFAAVARGQSPYGITFDDMYEPHEAFYVSEMRDGGRVMFGFPYPPLSLLMAWPGHSLLGDLRYSEVLAWVLAAGLLVSMRPDGIGLLCAAVLLLAPRLPFHIEQGWTEPFPVVLIAATVATALRRPSLAWLPLGLLMASKQHMALALIFAPWLAAAPWAGRQVLRFCLKAIGVALAVTLPLALLDPDAFYRSAILLQLREPFRLDSLSFARWLVTQGWPLDKEGAVVVSLTAGVAGIALAWWRAPRTPAGFAAALGLTCLLLTAFGKKAFLNYYMLATAALLIALAADRRVPTAQLQPDAVVGKDAPCSPETS
jgi:hypothetical protein